MTNTEVFAFERLLVELVVLGLQLVVQGVGERGVAVVDVLLVVVEPHLLLVVQIARIATEAPRQQNGVPVEGRERIVDVEQVGAKLTCRSVCP